MLQLLQFCSEHENMLFFGVFDFLYFRIVAVNGPCLLELADLEISFCNVYGAV